MAVRFAMGSEWILELKEVGAIRVSIQLIKKLRKYCQLDPKDPESGGILVGSHLNSGGAYIIDGFTDPQPSDRQSRHSYYRSEDHNIIVQRIWKESNQMSTYVGLWHTHPEPIPEYSGIDKSDWISAINHSQYEGDFLFFFILGQTHLRCWVSSKKYKWRKIKLLGEYKIDND